VVENGAEWRFFEGLKRHFVLRGADGPRSQTASLPDLTSVDSGCLEPPLAQRIGNEAPFFTDWGTNRHVGDRRDLTIAAIGHVGPGMADRIRRRSGRSANKATAQFTYFTYIQYTAFCRFR